MATVNNRSAYIMVWNYYDKNDLSADNSQVELHIAGIKASKVKVVQYRVDQEHSNSFTEWKRMGSPQQPDAAAYQKLEAAGHLQTMNKAKQLKVKNNRLNLDVELPRQAVALFKLTW